MTAVWPWLALGGLGAFHGLNPAMGWLFAVALGLHRRSRRVVLISLAPIAAGHALSILLVAIAVAVAGAEVDPAALRLAAGAILIGWALYRALYGHRHRVRVGMTASLAGLLLWSFVMASAHGAGLMLAPALIPLCTARPGLDEGSLAIALAAVAVHTLATLAVTGAVALVVYDRLGVEFLRRRWINFDILWTGMLVLAGVILIAA
ncbi:MAG TPA: hypothetical protein VI113_11790 [Alphaproteobacteria bacterium]